MCEQTGWGLVEGAHELLLVWFGFTALHDSWRGFTALHFVLEPPPSIYPSPLQGGKIGWTTLDTYQPEDTKTPLRVPEALTQRGQTEGRMAETHRHVAVLRRT
jgi:hypothetical protein